MRRALPLGAALLLSAPAAVAQTAPVPQIQRQVTAKAGATTRIGTFASLRKNCTPGPLPTVRLLDAPAHGRVVVRLAHVNLSNYRACLFTRLSALVAFYKPTAGFVGTDVLTLQIATPEGKTRLEKFIVTVKPQGPEKDI